MRKEVCQRGKFEGLIACSVLINKSQHVTLIASLLAIFLYENSFFDLHSPFIDMPAPCCLTTTASAALNEQGSQIFFNSTSKKTKERKGLRYGAKCNECNVERGQRITSR